MSKKKKISVWLNEDLANTFKNVCKVKGDTMTFVLKRMIESYLPPHPKKWMNDLKENFEDKINSFYLDKGDNK